MMNRRLSVKEKARRKWERMKKTIESNPDTTYDVQKKINKSKQYEDIGGRY